MLIIMDVSLLTLFRMGLFGLLTDGGCPKRPPLPKICRTCLAIMKLGTVIPYLKKIQKLYEHVKHDLSSADIRVFSLEINKYCSIKKYRYRLHIVT